MAAGAMPLVVFTRGPKPVLFEIPREDPPIDVDISELDFGETETRKGPAYRADSTEEIDPNDVLAEFPVDPEEQFEMRVPDAILERAALLATNAGHVNVQARRLVAEQPGGRRVSWMAATVAGVVLGLAAAASLSVAFAAPSTSTAGVAQPLVKAHHPRKTVARPASPRASVVPTVSFDSLPRAR